MDSTSDRTVPATDLGHPYPPTARPAHQQPLIAATGLALLAATVITGCRAAGTDGVTPVPQLLAFLPWLLVPTAVCAVFAALLRWRTGLVWALVLLAVTWGYARPYATGGAAAASPAVARIDVLTSNVEFGRATLGLISTIRREKPDLVFVQECEFVCSGLLADRVPRSDYPYRHLIEAGQAEGSAILSVHPLSDAEGVPGVLAMPGSEARIGGRTVALQLAHPLPPVPGGVGSWRQELGRLGDYAAGHRDGPVILAGDFNATRHHAAFRKILDAGGLRDGARVAGAGGTPSWPAAVPRPLGTQIDHVLVSKDFSVRKVRFLDLADTDHRSLLVTLDLHAHDRG